MRKPVALSIAGIDTGNGAGAESDLKVYEILGVHGVIAVTALTAQSTTGIRAVLPTPPEFLKTQLDTLFDDFEIKDVKIGMIYNKDQFAIVRDYLRDKRVVTDPVLFAKDGTQLIKDLEEYKRNILRNTTVLTPNIPEASYLSSMKISSIEEVKLACKTISKDFNIPYVVIKGGHAEDDYSIDVLYDSNRDLYYGIGYKRLNQKHTHGTGSVFATAVSAELSKGNDILTALRQARSLLQDSIYYGLEIGHGIGPIDPMVPIVKKSMKFDVIQEMTRFSQEVESVDGFYKLIPEVQSNLAHSIPSQYVRGLEDIATFRDRIVKNWDNRVKVGLPAVFGKPTHTARLLLSILPYETKASVLMNIRFEDKIVNLLKEVGYNTLEINRELEPMSNVEGKSMQWIASYIHENYGRIPNVIFDRGVKGKEAMIRFWTSSIDEMIDTLKYLAKNL
ncbi:phosphomethylpyrimidine kinase [Sulfolobus acidocaldarius SUSAZ]|nr:phosphomethylpyrimidine kinase [Sulfolobus acidocaldarius SUSAZ]